MRSAELMGLALGLWATLAVAAPTGALVPSAAFTVPVEEARAPAPPAVTRRLAEGGVVLGLGVVAPFASYLGFTTRHSFSGFFGGLAVASAVGLVLAPAVVTWVGRALGAEGSVGRAVVGALLGLGAGLLVGLPLATLPNDGYLAGLGVAWALPSLGAWAGLELGAAR